MKLTVAPGTDRRAKCYKMEIRRWQIYIAFNCVLITHLAAKSVSLNELIAAESKQKQEKIQRPKSTDTVSTSKPFSPKEALPAASRQNVKKTRFPKLSAKTPRRQSFSLKDLFASETKQTKRKIESFLSKTSGGGLRSHRKRLLPSLSLNNLESGDSLLSRTKTLTPLKYRKRFEIKSPLRPKRLKYSFKPRYNRNTQSKKREIFENEKINKKYNYIPLIKRLGVLVDDILSSGSGESYEYSSTERPKPRRNRQKQSTNRKEPKCKCDTRLDSGSTEFKPHKKAVVPPTTVFPEITTDTEDTTTATATTAANHTPARNVYTVKPDPNLSLLFTRNSTSPRRDYHGFSERSSPTLHGDLERNITWNNGDDQHYSRGERNQTCSPVYAENSCGSTRDDAGGDGSISRLHGDRTRSRHPDARHEAEETDEISTKPDRFIRRDNEDNEEKNKFQTGRTAEEKIPLPGDIRRLREFLPEDKNVTDPDSVQPKENGEESIFNVTHDRTSSERIAQWNGATATENQRLRAAVETVTPLNNLMNQDFLKKNSQPNQVVTIFDGYSVARDINGRNKLSEKSIHISS